MSLQSVFQDDLLPIASTIAQEIELCCLMADEVQGQWNNETNALLSFTLASGVAQLLHLQRACLLETLQSEHAAQAIHAAK